MGGEPECKDDREAVSAAEGGAVAESCSDEDTNLRQPDSVLLPLLKQCEDTRSSQQSDTELRALLKQHEDALVQRIDTLMREHLTSQVQPLRTSLQQDIKSDERVASRSSRAPADTVIVNTSGLDDDVAAPPRMSEWTEAGGVPRRMSTKLADLKAPDMVHGALDLRKHFTPTSRPWLASQSLALQKFMEKNPIRGFMRAMTMHPCFDTFFAGVVVFSVVMIGYEIQVSSEQPDAKRDMFFISQAICFCLFFFEVTIRMGAGGKKFFFSRDYKWNMFDLVCLSAMTAELFGEAAVRMRNDIDGPGTPDARTVESGRILRVLRLLRIVRALRIMRATRTSREFRKMSYALQYSAQTLFWALLLLAFVMYFFATTFTQAASEVLIAEGVLPQDVSRSSNLFNLVDSYGTIPKSFRSLFMAISSGRDWHELVLPLTEHVHWTFTALFVIFIAVTVFGIMNVLTSVFVESALQSVQHYKDLLIQESMKAKKMYVDHLREVFREIDTDLSGEITMEEMEQFLTDPSLMQYLESMDIQPDDARTLFRLLDKDDSGCISIEEFCNGCLRLKGDAKSFDIHCIIFENHRLLFKWKEYMHFMENGFVPIMQKAVEQALEKRLGPKGRLVPDDSRRITTRIRTSTAEEQEASGKQQASVQRVSIPAGAASPRDQDGKAPPGGTSPELTSPRSMFGPSPRGSAALEDSSPALEDSLPRSISPGPGPESLPPASKATLRGVAL